MLASDWQEGRVVRRLNRVASLRILFPSASANRAHFVLKAAGLQTIPLRRFSSLRFCCHSSSQAADVVTLATVDRTRSCVTGLFLGGVPLSMFDWLRSGRSVRHTFCKRKERIRFDNTLGIFVTLRSLHPGPQGGSEFQFFGSGPACCLMNVHPDYFCRGIDRQICTCPDLCQ